jgi:hypothetical protein
MEKCLRDPVPAASDYGAAKPHRKSRRAPIAHKGMFSNSPQSPGPPAGYCRIVNNQQKRTERVA